MPQPTTSVLRAVPNNDGDNNLLQMSSHRKRKSFLPEDLIRTTFNVSWQLQNNLSDYTGGKSVVTVMAFPSYLQIMTEQLKRRIKIPPNNRNPGFDPTYTCCLVHGMLLLGDHGMLQQLNKIRTEIYTGATEVNMDELEALHQIICRFETSFISGATQRVRVRIPGYVAMDLGELASELGMSQSDTLVLSVLSSLLSQSETESFQKSKIRSVLVPFFKMLKIRLKLLETLKVIL